MDNFAVAVKEKTELNGGTVLLIQVCLFCSYAHLDIYSGLNSNLNRQHHRLESRYSSSSGGSYEEEKSKRQTPCTINLNSTQFSLPPTFLIILSLLQVTPCHFMLTGV